MTTRTYSSIVDENLQTCEIQLAILQEEEERLLRLKAEKEKGSWNLDMGGQKFTLHVIQEQFEKDKWIELFYQ